MKLLSGKVDSLMEEFEKLKWKNEKLRRKMIMKENVKEVRYLGKIEETML